MMAAPPQYLDGLPSMFKDSKADPFRSTMGSGFRRHAQPSPAMSIPGSHDQHDVPPPLPPPRFLPSFHKDPNPFGAGFSPRDERPDYMRRVKPDPDEGYASLSTASTRSSQGLPSLSEFGLSHMQFSSSIDDYDKDIKRKLDPIKTFSTASPANRSLLSASMQEPSTRRYAPETRLAPLSVPSALPFHTRHNPTFESPNRYTETPLSAISPRSTPFSITSDYPSRSPYDTPDLDRSPRYRSRRANSGSVPDDMTVSTQGSYGEDDMEIDSAEPTSSISRLRIIDDYHHSLPQKRRALSPPGEDQPPTTLHGMPSQGDLFRQRNIASRGSPTPRLSMQPAASIASTMSTTSRSGSNFSVTSSMTSYGRRSPNGPSPGGLSPVATDVSCSSPYMTPTSNPSPRASLARGPLQRSMQTFHMCDCCPKKPRKFDTEEELRAHEAEKQYECSFCGNRFKNKNEAERHQNSLHVRRHSWSCSALYAYDKAFHESTNRPGEADTCGYCGDEFPRSGRGAGGGRVATEEDWVERNRHLQEVHKFRECNSSKKFYRADHFRQHLKHSHQGTPGKWTNMLENACMMEEEPPMPR